MFASAIDFLLSLRHYDVFLSHLSSDDHLLTRDLVSLSEPLCWLSENETLQLGCDVIYTGSVSPTINCSTQQSASVPNRSIVSFDDGVTNTVMYRQDMESAIKLNGTLITCYVYVDWSSMVGQSQQCSNNSLSHVYTWTSLLTNQIPQGKEAFVVCLTQTYGCLVFVQFSL